MPDEKAYISIEHNIVLMGVKPLLVAATVEQLVLIERSLPLQNVFI